jgi:MoxR-like ATPase
MIKFKVQPAKSSTLIGLDAERDALRYAMASGMPSLLIGETGTGKTSLAIEVAESLGLEVIRLNMDGNVTADQFIGRGAADGARTFFEVGILPQAMKRGAVLILDEVNMSPAEVLALVYSVAERKPSLTIKETGERFTAADGFCLVATMNPTADYAGTRELSHALKSRFGLTVEFPRLSGVRLVEALKAQVPTAADVDIVNIAAILEKVGDLQISGEVSARLSIREGVSALQMLRDGMPYKLAVKYAIVGKLEAADRAAIEAAGVKLDGRKVETVATVEELVAASGRVADLEKALAKSEREVAKLAKVAQLVAALGESPEKSKTAAAV